MAINRTLQIMEVKGKWNTKIRKNLENERVLFKNQPYLLFLLKTSTNCCNNKILGPRIWVPLRFNLCLEMKFFICGALSVR